MTKNKFTASQKEFELAWQEFFNNLPKPSDDEEEKKQMEEFTYWYNNIRKQTDTNKTPIEMYKEIYSKEPPGHLVEDSRIIQFEWDEDYDEEIIGLIEELKEYDNYRGYKLSYEVVRKKLEVNINKIIKKGEKALALLYPLLEEMETWSSLFVLEILKEIKSEKSIPYIINFIINNEAGDCSENCEIAMDALINIGKPTINEIIHNLEREIENKFYCGYLFEALSTIKDSKGNEFKLKILKDFINNSKKYCGWFDLILFISNFDEEDKDALPFLEQLKEMNITKEEKLELADTIELIKNPEEYNKKIERESEVLKKILKNFKRKDLF